MRLILLVFSKVIKCHFYKITLIVFEEIVKTDYHHKDFIITYYRMYKLRQF